jgi:zinc protease
MRSATPARTVFAALALIGPASALGAPSAAPNIPFEKYTLPNGLEVILHQDRRVPTVYVEVVYKVGSKDESPGKTGFAHLFEHVMFQGTKHLPEDKHFKFLQEAGASNINGSTNFDRTNYYQQVPSNQLPLALWLESERMGFLLERPSFKETLDNQRDVVKNERRQRVENAPMGALNQVRLEAMYPAGHPYHHEVIGSMTDLSAAREEDIKSFFYKWYAPNNAVLCVAGDFDTEATKSLVAKYFGAIPPGPALVRPPAPPAALAGEKRIAMEAKVERPFQMMVWHSPANFKPGDAELDVLAGILSAGKTSRLYQRLVYELKIAQTVGASQSGNLLAGSFSVTFSPMPGHTLAEIEKLVDEELEKVRSEPVQSREIERVKNQIETGMFDGLESIAGRAGRLLAYNTYLGDPGYIGQDLARFQAVNATQIQQVASTVLRKDARLVITVEPNPEAPIMGRVKR